MNKYQFNICIIGAGVVGLAIAEKLSNYLNDISQSHYFISNYDYSKN